MARPFIAGAGHSAAPLAGCCGPLRRLRLLANPAFTLGGSGVEPRPHNLILEGQMHRAFHKKPDMEEIAFCFTVETLTDVTAKNIEFSVHSVINCITALEVLAGQNT